MPLPHMSLGCFQMRFQLRNKRISEHPKDRFVQGTERTEFKVQRLLEIQENHAISQASCSRIRFACDDSYVCLRFLRKPAGQDYAVGLATRAERDQ